MSGIKDIQNRRQQEQEKQKTNDQELWIKDGEQVQLAIVPTGAKEDTRLDDFYFHINRVVRDTGSAGWNYVLCQKDTEKGCLRCMQGDKPSHKFAIWAYVYSIFHPTKVDGKVWEEVKSPSGTVKYKEAINDFRVFIQGFGKSDYLWNQLVDIYTENGSLDKNVVRVVRRGTGFDTTYSFNALPTIVKMSAEEIEKAKRLPSIISYISQVYGEKVTDFKEVPLQNVKVEEEVLDFGDPEEEDDLPF